MSRLISLDVFRGLTLALMVLVNNHGDPAYVYPPLAHVRWHGWTPTDLVFPFFIFVVGTAIPFAFGNRLARGEKPASLHRQIVRRTLLLFLLGLILNGFPRFDLGTLRIMGILQRIALCYLACALLYLHTSPRTRAWITGGLLVFYCAVLTLVPVPGYGVPVLSREGNWVQYFDIRLMAGHLQSRTFEGKGLLSTLPAIANCLLGLMAGECLRSKREPLEKVAWLYTAGAVGMGAGAVWSIWFPINQNLWTSSLVLFMCGMAAMLLAACYYLIDIQGFTGWTKPFLIFGLNSITIWMGSSLLMRTLQLTDLRLPIAHWFASWAGNYNGSLIFALLYVLLWYGLMSLLYRRGIFLKV